ncbi:cytosolic endo-beta-N-acetylglucosaminidase-like isoform X3 [Watersipora subatra]|uniref:cytosolic endo-beta-N-acetylglucosaminidase-like isoform X3 n=1 Tax=Watersipora subatra TaxID=2589382 RepID=UPI00355C1379
MLHNTADARSPCATPINSLDEVFGWQPSDDYFVGVAPLEPTQRLENRPKTLACHDMNGGYLEDRFVQGSEKYDAYRFYHWHLLDTFVYFSHHMITIPPPCWINAAHKHGVPVLGTFITEWEDGQEKCAYLLGDISVLEQFVDQMVNIAVHHSMDGWLINIENEIRADQIGNLVLFLRLLTQRMHLAIPGSQVIWYDSVTVQGDLTWQNELNELNSIFFDECDAIFLNYTWTAENLVNSARNSGERLQDVFVGIDVFGRGMIGGGGYNTKEALALARKAQLSIALFAPGWVYEVNGSREFDANEESVFRFWYYLQPYLPMHVSCTLPLASSFCQGWGKKTYIHGQAISDQPWSNLSMQQPQPTLTHSDMGHNPHQKYKWLHLEDGFMGGGAMRFVGRLPSSGKALTYSLFDTAIPMETSVYVRYTVKQMHMEKGAKLFLYLILNKDENEERILLPEEQAITDVYMDLPTDITIQCMDDADVPVSLKSPVATSRALDQWQSRVYFISSDLLKGKSLDEVGLLAYTENKEALMLNALVGNVQVLSSSDASLRPVSVSDVTCDDLTSNNLSTTSHLMTDEDKTGKSLSLRLQWCQPDIDADITSYHIWCNANDTENRWLGSTYCNKFYISNLPVDEDKGILQFTIQVQYKSGVIENIKHAGRYVFTY